ncbi:hypothetical protein [Paenibacillus riograndensis]|uniref:Putative membrane protein n=1 Tax=Paenibacillus riograndensis SBR5 TaxID=1073571 RepID=A0A0E4CXH2_9BACL|nr:hypothetical protein [Paenibacillus riograndensis]CQR56380.1 putative membrane protein [Paenibacillus riograndensis SBR5]
MTSFEQELRRRIRIMTLYAVTIGITVIVAFVLKAFVYGSIDTLDSWDIGILAGLLLGAEVSAFLRIARLRRALQSSEVLEALHIAEKDERNRMIALRTARAGMTLTILLLSLSAVAASLISKVVFLTIAIILAALLALYFVLAAYYSRKM